MHLFTKLYVRVTERIAERKGQAMSEYALVLSAVAIAGFLSFKSVGNKIGTLLNNVISDL